MHLLVTGGAGFIGSNFIHYTFAKNPDWRITNLDKLTYAGNLANLDGITEREGYEFVQGDIADATLVQPLIERADIVVNFAAETHVDRSIEDPGQFILTDVYGTFVLLEAIRRCERPRLFIQISTDEVYGSIATGSASETSPLDPRNPYSASKAGADRLAYSYFTTYGVPSIVTRASNNYGPRQYPEKLIPLFVTNALEDLPLPLYGDGAQVRDWLHVDDHCQALLHLIEHGAPGETYNIGGGNERSNLELTERILNLLGKPSELIQRVKDRPGHDRRYSLSTRKLEELGWSPAVDFEAGLSNTIEWYQNRPDWWQPIKQRDPEYRRFYEANYRGR